MRIKIKFICMLSVLLLSWSRYAVAVDMPGKIQADTGMEYPRPMPLFVPSQPVGNCNGDKLMQVGNNVYFFEYPYLWRTDGTGAGTEIVCEFPEGTVETTPYTWNCNNKELYLAFDHVSIPRGERCVTVWASGGTIESTRIIGTFVAPWLFPAEDGVFVVDNTNYFPFTYAMPANMVYFAAVGESTAILLHDFTTEDAWVSFKNVALPGGNRLVLGVERDTEQTGEIWIASCDEKTGKRNFYRLAQLFDLAGNNFGSIDSLVPFKGYVYVSWSKSQGISSFEYIDQVYFSGEGQIKTLWVSDLATGNQSKLVNNSAGDYVFLRTQDGVRDHPVRQAMTMSTNLDQLIDLGSIDNLDIVYKQTMQNGSSGLSYPEPQEAGKCLFFGDTLVNHVQSSPYVYVPPSPLSATPYLGPLSSDILQSEYYLHKGSRSLCHGEYYFMEIDNATGRGDEFWRWQLPDWAGGVYPYRSKTVEKIEFPELGLANTRDFAVLGNKVLFIGEVTSPDAYNKYWVFQTNYLWVIDYDATAPVLSQLADSMIPPLFPYQGPEPKVSTGSTVLFWQLVQGPPGMSIDPATGVVWWWTPVLSNEPYTVIIRGLNCAGQDETSWQLRVVSQQSLLLEVTAGGTVEPNTETQVFQGVPFKIKANADTGFTFTDWTVVSGNALIADAKAAETTVTITAPTTIRANFAINTYTVTFDLGGEGTSTGGGALSQTINYGSAAIEPIVTAIAGWNFVGWDKSFDSITSNLTVTAQYIADTTVAPSFTMHPSNMSVTAGQTASFTVSATGTPTPTYQWQVSTDGGGIWTNVTTGTGGTTSNYTTAVTVIGDNGKQYRCVATNSVTSATSDAATLTVNELPPLTYTVTFDLAGKGTRTGGGELVQTVNHSAAAIAPTVTANSGWNFTGWDRTFDNITEDTTVTAQYSLVTCTVTYDAEGGSVSPASTVVTFGAPYGTLATPTRNGYTFAGWWTGDNGTGTQVTEDMIASIATDHTIYAKWDGSKWSSLDAGINGAVLSAAFDNYGNLYIGGEFGSVANGVTCNYMAKWDGTSWSALGSGMNGIVRALACDGAGNLYAGGDFTKAGGKSANHIAKWNGTSWIALGSGLNGSVNALACSSAGILFASYDAGLSGNRVAKWNGSSWTSYATNGAVNALACDSAGNLYAGGAFLTVGGVHVNRIAKLNPNTGKWSALESFDAGYEDGIDGSVNALVCDGLGNLYVGGKIDYINGVKAWNIAGWDGYGWYQLGNGLRNEYGYSYGVFALACDISGNLYAAGDFNLAGDVHVGGIAKWDGENWSSLDSWVDGVRTLAYDGAGDIYVGGNFESVGNLYSPYLVKCHIIDEPIFTIAATAGAGGTIIPSGNTRVILGTSKTFTVTPSYGYRVTDLEVDGVSVGAITSYTFNNITENRTISATFEKIIDCPVIFTAGAGGSIYQKSEPTQQVKFGKSSKPVKAVPDKGWRFYCWTLNGELFSTVNPLTVKNIQSRMELTAVFLEIPAGLTLANMSSSRTDILKSIRYPGGDGEPGYTDHFVQSSDKYGFTFAFQMGNGWANIAEGDTITVTAGSFTRNLIISNTKTEQEITTCSLNGAKGGSASWTFNKIVTNENTGIGRYVTVLKATLKWTAKGVMTLTVTGTPLPDTNENICNLLRNELGAVVNTLDCKVVFESLVDTAFQIPYSGNRTERIGSWVESSGEPGIPGEKIELPLEGWDVKGKL